MRKAAKRAVADIAPRYSHGHASTSILPSRSITTAIAFICIIGGLALVKYELRRHVYASYLPQTPGALMPAPDGGTCGKYEPSVPGCSPRGKSCGHLVVDDFATSNEVDALRAIAARGMALGGGAGGPTILDLQSGALSYGDKFVDVWSVFNATEGAEPFRRSELQVYEDVVRRIAALAESTFGVSSAKKLHLTAPTFFSRISGDKRPKTAHDEYWHTHTDLEQYGSFVITSLLYLADSGTDFEGGVFEFMPPGTGQGAKATPLSVVAPRRGKLMLFSSGPEHPHRVTRVTSGTRLALTIAFTCDDAAAIEDFLGRALPG